MNEWSDQSSTISRRTLLKQLAVGSGVVAAGRWSFGDHQPDVDVSFVLQYLETLARDDGGYAWADQPVSHLSPTFAVIACYHALRQQVPRPTQCAQFVRTHHPTEWKKLEQEHREFDYQQMQSLVWLGEDIQSFKDRVAGWKAPVPYLAQYERHRYPVFRFQLAAVTCRHLLELPASELPTAWADYLQSRRRPNGSFNNSPADAEGDGNILNTWWGLEALRIIGQPDALRIQTVDWLQKCQGSDGGFRWQPDPAYGKSSDAAYTWAAVKSLSLLGSEPLDRQGVIGYLLSLRNSDGGFGDRPGWASNAMATRYAVESLHALRALEKLTAPATRSITAKAVLPEGLKVFSIQIEAHGTGSPTEAVNLAGELKIDLWGAKNASPRWIEVAQSIADRERIPVRFFRANEEYGSWIDMPGFGTYSHMSDVITPAGAQTGRPANDREGTLTWLQFQSERVAPLHANGGRLIWQFGENEELVRTVLDASLESGGYDAISTFHFGNPDFTNSEPFLNRYRGQLPYVALQDAHGPEPWWFADMTTGFRTLFLAPEPTWDHWLTALQRNWVVAVRHDAVTKFETRIHGGSDEVTSFVTSRESQWRWWDNPSISRPLVSIVAVRAADEFEAFRPEAGIVIRVRCAWNNTAQGQPKTPLAKLKTLLIDGERVEPELIERPNTKGTGLIDHVHLVRLPQLSPGEHCVEATVARLADNRDVTRQIRFRN